MIQYEGIITWPDGARVRAAANTGAAGLSTLAKDAPFKGIQKVSDTNDPTNPTKVWMQLDTGGFIAVKYPASSGDGVRAVYHEVGSPPPPTTDPIKRIVKAVVTFERESGEIGTQELT